MTKLAKNAGIKYAVLTVKHTGGWCLWDSKFTTSYDITAFKNYKNGKGDIVKMLILSNSRRVNYLLNIAPDNTTLITEHTVQRLKEFRALMDKH